MTMTIFALSSRVASQAKVTKLSRADASGGPCTRELQKWRSRLRVVFLLQPRLDVSISTTPLPLPLLQVNTRNFPDSFLPVLPRLLWSLPPVQCLHHKLLRCLWHHDTARRLPPVLRSIVFRQGMSIADSPASPDGAAVSSSRACIRTSSPAASGPSLPAYLSSAV